MSTQHSLHGISSGDWLLLSRLEPTAHEIPHISRLFPADSAAFPKSSTHPRGDCSNLLFALPTFALLFLRPARLLPNPYQDLSFTVTSLASDHPVKTSTGITYHITVIALAALLANSREKG